MIMLHVIVFNGPPVSRFFASNLLIGMAWGLFPHLAIVNVFGQDLLILSDL